VKPFFFISGSDFVEMFVGVGAARVRDMFEEAKKNAPCIIFVDEIDAIGRHRGAGTGGGNDEREQTLNQLLVEMDGFDKKDGSAEPVIIIAATNRPDVLDPALLRPGRFDRQITVPNPDITDREPIIELYFQQHGGVEADVSAKDWAARTTNCSPADLNNLINEAAILRDKAGKPLIADEHMHQAWDKIQMGSPRKLSLTDAELRATSAHEGGHVFGAIYGGLDKFLRFDKVSITPRSNSLGVTILNALRDPVSMTYEQVLASLICLQGGREAELLMHGGDPSKVTSGCSNDIKRAAEAAHQALTQQGFGVFVDPVNLTAMAYDTNTPDPFLGKTMALGAGSSCSEETQRHIDQAAHKMISESAAAVAKILKEHGEEWVAVVNELYAKQTMSREEVYAVINAVRVKNGLEPLDGTAVFEVVDHPLEWTAITAQLAERETAAAI
jgi:cell division protease FtsH